MKKVILAVMFAVVVPAQLSAGVNRASYEGRLKSAANKDATRKVLTDIRKDPAADLAQDSAWFYSNVLYYATNAGQNPKGFLTTAEWTSAIGYPAVDESLIDADVKTAMDAVGAASYAVQKALGDTLSKQGYQHTKKSYATSASIGNKITGLWGNTHDSAVTVQ